MMALPMRYHARIYRREHLWLPGALWALFALLVILMRSEAGRAFDVANAFLGFVLPLIAGILAASAIVDDSALELQLASPRAPWRTLLERLALLLGLVAAGALLYQGYVALLGVDLSPMGKLVARQLAWLTPSLALMGLGSVTALAFAQGTNGALAAGGIWLLQLLAKDWFVDSPWARYLFVFMAARYQAHPSFLANQLCLLGVSAILIAGASLLLKQEERYL